MNPPKSILDPTFVYVPAVDTDIRKLFERVRAERLALERTRWAFPPVTIPPSSRIAYIVESTIL
jgi:hypothetical protein